MTRAARVTLYWLPLGAGGRSVSFNGRVFEAIVARRTRRPARDLYHSALEVETDGDRFVIEMTPAWGNGIADRGVVREGPVGSRWLGRFSAFRYEVRRWRGGAIPDIGEAVGGPRPFDYDAGRARLLVDLVPQVPALTWGRDEMHTGEMWNSNSLTAWLLARSGDETGRLGPALLGGVIIAHGALHLIGAASGLGGADISALTRHIGVAMGVVWLLAAGTTVAAGTLFLASVRRWWMVGAAAVVLSQFVIVSDWSDAAFGTVVNLLLAVTVLYAYAAHGPNSFETEYRRRTADALSTMDTPVASGPIVTEADLEPLPGPVARYVRQSGAVGRPRVGSFRAVFHGRIRAGADKPWMEFTGEQVNTYGPGPDRFFTMDATMAHLPVDVLHVFTGDSATMRVKLCSLIPMVNTSGPDLTRAETVTLLNDLCVLAPAALPDARITWTPMDDQRTRATFTRGEHTVTADLTFNGQGQLVDFTSDDRYRSSSDGRALGRERWSTPLRNYRSIHGRTISTSGRACWDTPEAGRFTYLEFEVDDITYRDPGGS